MNNIMKHRAIVDTHRHPTGPKMQARMAEHGLYDPKRNTSESATGEG
jgi:hypothetical protein